MDKDIEGSWNRLSKAFSLIRANSSTYSTSCRPGTATKRLASMNESKYSLTGLFSPVKSQKLRPQTAGTRKSGTGTSSNPILRSIYVGRCKDLKLSQLNEQEKRFYTYCEKSFKNREIVLKEAGFGQHTAKAIGLYLSKNPPFSELSLSKNVLSDRGLLLLADFLRYNSTLIHVDVSSNNVSPEAIGPFFKILGSHKSITSLDISSHEGLHRNRIGLKGAQAFSQLFRSPILTMLNISGTYLGNEGLLYLLAELKFNKTLLYLNIASNEITGKCMERFAEVLVTTGISDLSLASNKLGDEGSHAISKIINSGFDFPLTRFDLSKNGTTSKGVFALLSNLQNNGSLRYLNLEGNPLGVYAGSAISSCLYNNSELFCLNLNDCELNSEGVVSMCSGLTANHGLGKLILSKNKLEDSAVIAISHSLLKNRVLKSLDLSDNNIGNTGGMALASALKSNVSLVNVNLNQNNLKDKVGAELAEVVRFRPAVSNISLEENLVSVKFLVKIKELTNHVRSITPKKETMQPNFSIGEIKTEHSEVQLMIHTKAKEQKDLSVLLKRNIDKLSESRVTESNKFRELRKRYDELRIYNKNCSKRFEEINTEIYKIKIQSEKQVRYKEQALASLLAQTKIKEKEKTENKESFNLKRIYVEGILQETGKELQAAGLDHREALKNLQELKKHASDLRGQIHRLKEPKKRKKVRRKRIIK